MLTKNSYLLFKPIDIMEISNKYHYGEITIEVNVFCLFGFIPIYKTQKTIHIDDFKQSLVKPKIRKLK